MGGYVHFSSVLKRHKMINENAENNKNPFDINFYNTHDKEYHGVYVYKISNKGL